MTLSLFILGLVAGTALLYYGAEFLVDGGSGTAKCCGVPPLVIGLTIVAFGTSAPELVVSISASLSGHGDISIGNVVGSNICNVGLILGLCAMVRPLPVHDAVRKFEAPFMLFCSLVFAGIYFAFKGVNRLSAVALLAIFAFYLWHTFKVTAAEGNSCSSEDKNCRNLKRLPLQLLLMLVGLAMLVGGAQSFLYGAVGIARLAHVSEAVIGLTLVAVGTSLPELAASLVAAVKGETDIAVGNVIGSNIFNILSILGIAPLISPIYGECVSMIDLGVMTLFALILIPFMCTGKSVNRLEGAVLFFGYAAYVAWLAMA